MIRQGLTGERLWALFVLGLVLLLPPLINAFNKPLLICGIPLLYLYLFVVWGGLIALAALTIEWSTAELDAAEDEAGAAGSSGAEGEGHASGPVAGRSGARPC